MVEEGRGGTVMESAKGWEVEVREEEGRAGGEGDKRGA